MSTFRLFARCEFCKKEHPLPFAVHLELGKSKKRNVGEIFNGKPIPRDIVNIMKNKVQCTKSERFFRQSDVNQVYLVPTGQSL